MSAISTLADASAAFCETRGRLSDAADDLAHDEARALAADRAYDRLKNSPDFYRQSDRMAFLIELRNRQMEGRDL